MPAYGLLVDQDWCTGCHSCEISCQTEHDFPLGQSGIVVTEIGPWQISKDKWQYSYLAIPGDQCDLCSERRELGKSPTCVKHCQAQCLFFGTLEELTAKLAEKPNQALFYVAE